MIVDISGVQVFPVVATQISFFNFVVEPNITMTVQYMLLDVSGNGLKNGYVSLTLSQYTGWGGAVDDDIYLPACYAANLGLHVIN